MANISQEVNIEMLEKLADGTYKKKHPETKASQVKLEDATGNFVATEVEGAMGELFTNVSDGKNLVGGAITGVDDSVVIPTDPTFGDLASAIGGISTGKKWASGVATATYVSNQTVLSVTGIPFEVSTFVAAYSLSNHRGAFIFMPPNVKIMVSHHTNGGGNTRDATVTQVGGVFEIKAFGNQTGQTYYWIAFE